MSGEVIGTCQNVGEEKGGGCNVISNYQTRLRGGGGRKQKAVGEFWHNATMCFPLTGQHAGTAVGCCGVCRMLFQGVRE